MLQRLFDLEIVDRSLAVGAQAFSALIPLLIVLAGWGARDGGSLADALVNRFGLDGDAADAVHRAFTATSTGTSLTVAGAVLVVLSALSFTRALQRVFERTWELPPRGWRATRWGLVWVASFTGYWALFPVVSDVFDGLLRWIIALGGTFAFWLLTPYLLLARRVAWKRLVLQGALTALGMTIVAAGSGIYAPRAMSSAASEFGTIGIAFTLLSLLWAGGFVVVGAAALGSYPFVVAQRPAQSRAIAAARARSRST
jgi:membrane protein